MSDDDLPEPIWDDNQVDRLSQLTTASDRVNLSFATVNDAEIVSEPIEYQAGLEDHWGESNTPDEHDPWLTAKFDAVDETRVIEWDLKDVIDTEPGFDLVFPDHMNRFIHNSLLSQDQLEHLEGLAVLFGMTIEQVLSYRSWRLDSDAKRQWFVDEEHVLELYESYSITEIAETLDIPCLLAFKAIVKARFPLASTRKTVVSYLRHKHIDNFRGRDAEELVKARNIDRLTGIDPNSEKKRKVCKKKLLGKTFTTTVSLTCVSAYVDFG